MRRLFAVCLGKLCLLLAQNKRPAFIEQLRKSRKLTMTLEAQTYTVPLVELNRTLKGFVCKLGG